MMPSLAKAENSGGRATGVCGSRDDDRLSRCRKKASRKCYPLLLGDLAEGQTVRTRLSKTVWRWTLNTFQEKWKLSMMKHEETDHHSRTQGPAERGLNPTGNSTAKRKERNTSEVGANDDRRILTFLGDILKSRNEFKAAIIEYEKAFEESETQSPILFNKIAGTYLILKDITIMRNRISKRALAALPRFSHHPGQPGRVVFCQRPA